MENLVLAGKPFKDSCLLQLSAKKRLLDANLCYAVEESPEPALSVRPLDPKLRAVGAEKAFLAADTLILHGEAGPQLKGLLGDRKTISFEAYAKSRSHPADGIPTIPVSTSDDWLPDTLDQVAEFAAAGYPFYLYSSRPDWDAALAFTKYRKPDAPFAVCLVDAGPQTAADANLLARLRRFSRGHVRVRQYTSWMHRSYEGWKDNLHRLPDGAGELLYLACSRSVRRLSKPHQKILRALEDGSPERLNTLPREELEQFSAMCRYEEWKGRYFEALLRTHAVRIDNYDDIIVSYIGSHRCNLKCRYCFADHTCEALSQMPPGDAVAVAELLTGNRHNPNVHFDNNLGGEPLLNWEAVKKLHLALIAYHKTRGIKASFGLLTNGTQLKPEHLEWLRMHLPYVGVSLDGDRETHDAIRRGAAGEPTYDRAVEGIRLLQDSDWDVECGVSAVLTRNNLNISAIEEHLRDDLGIPNIVMKPVRAAAGEDYALTLDDLPALEAAYRAFFRFLLREGENGNLKPLFAMLQPLDYAGRFLLRAFCADRVIVKRCGSGEHIYSVADDATVYPCDSFNGIHSFEIASLQEGKHNRADYSVPFVTEENEAFGCSRCWARWLCGGICQYVQYLNHYEHNDVTRLECGLAKFLIESALWFWQEARRRWDTALLEQIRERIETIGFHATGDPDAFLYAPC